jgi:hypothetical protein
VNLGRIDGKNGRGSGETEFLTAKGRETREGDFLTTDFTDGKFDRAE